MQQILRSKHRFTPLRQFSFSLNVRSASKRRNVRESREKRGDGTTRNTPTTLTIETRRITNMSAWVTKMHEIRRNRKCYRKKIFNIFHRFYVAFESGNASHLS